MAWIFAFATVEHLVSRGKTLRTEWAKQSKSRKKLEAEITAAASSGMPPLPRVQEYRVVKPPPGRIAHKPVVVPPRRRLVCYTVACLLSPLYIHTLFYERIDVYPHRFTFTAFQVHLDCMFTLTVVHTHIVL